MKGIDMLFNCGNCFRCCCHFTKDTMGPFIRTDEIYQIGSQNVHKVKFSGIDEPMTVMKRKDNRCMAWSYEEHCTIYSVRPVDCLLYPFMVKDGNMIIHLTCPDAVRILQLIDAGNAKAERFYLNAKDIIMRASEKYLRYLEYQTKNFQFYCVVK